jgi:hypothetical protein
MSIPCEAENIVCANEASFVAQPSQQELSELYEEQQRRLACPSCGEEPFID